MKRHEIITLYKDNMSSGIYCSTCTGLEGGPSLHNQKCPPTPHICNCMMNDDDGTIGLRRTFENNQNSIISTIFSCNLKCQCSTMCALNPNGIICQLKKSKI